MENQNSTAATPLELHRLAASLVEATSTGNEQQTLAVLASVTEQETGTFLMALASMVEHALRANPAAGLPEFLLAYRRTLDTAEARGPGADA